VKAKDTVSVIIVSYNTCNLLKQTLNSIYQAEGKPNWLEILVVDNNSQDGSWQMVKKEFPKIRLMALKKNLGFAKANNLAAAKASGKYLLFLNSDTILRSRAIAKMINFSKAKPKVGIVGPKLLAEPKKVQAFGMGYKTNLKQKIKTHLAPILANFGFSRKWLTKLSLEYWDWRRPRQVAWVTGAALMIKKDFFNKLGGFDAGFFMYFEDQDLCWRATRAGYQIWVLPQAKIIHLGGQSLNLTAQRKRYYYQSEDRFYQKHFSRKDYYLMRIVSAPFRWRSLLKK